MNIFSPIQVALIDLDGTLINTLGDFEAALHACTRDLGANPQPADRAFIARTIGRGSENLLRKTLIQVGIDATACGGFDHALERYFHHYNLINGQYSEIYTGVESGLLQMQQAGWRLACLTNKPSEYARSLLDKKGLLRHFEYVFGGDTFERKKPDPLPLQEACRIMQSAPDATLMVGDSANDAYAAQAAGCPAVLVNYGYNHGESVHDLPALALIERLDQLPLPQMQPHIAAAYPLPSLV